MFAKRFTNLSRRAVISRAGTTGESKFPRPLKTTQKGIDVLHDPLWNKGMGFSIDERDRLGLRGLLPPVVKTQAAQLAKAYWHVCICRDNML